MEFFISPGFGDWWNPVVAILSLAAGITGYIFLRKYLKLPFSVEKRDLNWCLEGVVMEHITLLTILKDVVKHLLGVLYIACTVGAVLNAFGAFGYFRMGSSMAGYAIGGFFLQLLLCPIAVRIAFEVLYLVIHALIKYIPIILGFIKYVIVFIWKAIGYIVHLPIEFIRWLSSACRKFATKNEVAILKAEAEKKSLTL